MGRMMLVLGIFGAVFSAAPATIRPGIGPFRAFSFAKRPRPVQAASRRRTGDDSGRPASALDREAREAGFLQANVRARVEPRIRHLVAEQLGVSPEELVPAASLTDELAADSLDMLQLVLALESAFDIVVPQRSIADMRSYRDVVDTVVVSLLDAGGDDLAARRDLLVRSRVTSGRAGAADELVRVDELTPYTIQTIEEDALRAGRGARVEVAVSSNASDIDGAALTYVRDQLAWLEERGIQVAVQRA